MIIIVMIIKRGRERESEGKRRDGR